MHSLSGVSHQYVLILITERAINITILLGRYQGRSTESWGARYRYYHISTNTWSLRLMKNTAITRYNFFNRQYELICTKIYYWTSYNHYRTLRGHQGTSGESFLVRYGNYHISTNIYFMRRLESPMGTRCTITNSSTKHDTGIIIS